MKHLLFTTLLLALLCANANSQTVSEADATEIARSFLHQHKQAPSRDAEASQLTLAHKAAQGDETYYYVFNYSQDDESKGFVIVGGDERSEVILGYSEHGSFDWNTAPDNVKWWLSQYEERLHAAIQQGLPSRYARPRAAAPVSGQTTAMAVAPQNRVTIPGMIKTKWSQESPYNNCIPQVSNSTEKFVTGCVATAMAQVMYYHRCPLEYGMDQHSYTRQYNDQDITFAANFGATKYNWDKMRLDYETKRYKEAEATAVAQLMYHVGVSVNMNYNYASRGGSGAMSEEIPYALYHYFGYDQSAEFVQRQYYTDAEWLSMIYDELAAGRPVLYGGYNAYGSGGHQFICHGYNADTQTFAINWGWGGSYDGYFTLLGTDGLQPHGNGTGGAGNGASYTSMQDAIIHIMPDAGGQKPMEIYNWDNKAPIFRDQLGQITTLANYDVASESQKMSYTLYPANFGDEGRNFELCLMLSNEQTGTSVYAEHIYCDSLPSLQYTTAQLNVKAEDLPDDGYYTVTPMIRAQGSTQWGKLRMASSVVKPTIRVIGHQSTPLQPVAFQIDGQQVEVYSQLSISHDPFYRGDIQYQCSDPELFSIDADGIITAQAPGTALITATASGNRYFAPTSVQYQVTATPYDQLPVEFYLSSQSIDIGKTCRISCLTTGYTGAVTFESDSPDIASVSDDGIVTGHALGTAIITVTVAGNRYYQASVQQFQITVSEQCFILQSYAIANGGYITQDNISITTTIWNNTGRAQAYELHVTFEAGFFSGEYKISYNYRLDETLTKRYTLPALWRENFPVGTIGTITITDKDGAIVVAPQQFQVCESQQICHTIPDEGWSTLCLPFDATIPDGMTIYSVSDDLDDEALNLQAASSIEHNTPYIVKGTPDIYTFNGPAAPTGATWTQGLLVGNTLSDTQQLYAPVGSYVLQNKGGILGFFRVKRSNYLQLLPYSAYICLPDEQGDLGYSCLVFEEEDNSLSAITTVLVDDEEDPDLPNYNLQGQRTSRTAKGLAIRNGRIAWIH